MTLLRLLLASLLAGAGLVLLTQTPASACSCSDGSTEDHVAWADVVFHGTLVEVDQTNPGDPDVVSSGDPTLYTFEVARTFAGDAGDGVVESARSGASCGLEGMKLDQEYVVFAETTQDGDPAGLAANLCGGTARATPQLLARVEAAVAADSGAPTTPTTAPDPTASPAGPGQNAVPTTVPSGVAPVEAEEDPAGWVVWGAGVLAALTGLLVVVVTRTRAAARD